MTKTDSSGDALKYRLIAIDLDGTLINHQGVIPFETKRAIQRALDCGIEVTLATGRMFRPSVRFAQELGLRVPLICYQGALIGTPSGRKVLWHKPLPAPIAREVVPVVRQTDTHLNVYLDDELYVEEITERAQTYARRNVVKLNLVEDLVAFLERGPTKMVALGDPAEIDALSARLTVDFGSRLLVTKSHPTFCEVGHPASGKGNALKYLAGLLGVERSQTVAIGDGPNDIDMLEWAGLGIAVGGASQEVRAVADWVTDAEAEDGVAQAVEKLLDVLD